MRSDAPSSSMEDVSGSRFGNRRILDVFGSGVSCAVIGVALLVGCGSRSGLSETLQGTNAHVGGAPTHAGSGSTSAGGQGAGSSSVDTGGTLGDGATNTGGTGSQDPKWRNTEELYCSPPGESPAVDLWGDERGIYVLVTGTRASLQSNDGSGWKEVPGSWEGKHLSGFVDGPMIAYGGNVCAIEFVSNGVTSCSGVPTAVTDLFTVDSTLAYAVYDNRVLVYDGNTWEQFGDPVAPEGQVYAQAIWADEQSALVGTDSGLFRMDSGKFELQSEASAIRYRAVWGFAADDLWAGNDDGQLTHFDGQHWSTVFEGVDDCRAIRGMWGTEGELYFFTRSTVFRMSEGLVEPLLELPCGKEKSFRALWGSSVNEVFVAVQDEDAEHEICAGDVQLLWFDGEMFQSL